MSASEEVYLIYTTFPDMEEAKKVSKQIVMGKLAACSNIIPGMTAIYEWEGQMEEGNEVIVIFKTTKSKVEEAADRIKSLHSYDVPAVLILNTLGGNTDFITWVNDQIQ